MTDAVSQVLERIRAELRSAGSRTVHESSLRFFKPGERRPMQERRRERRERHHAEQHEGARGTEETIERIGRIDVRIGDRGAGCDVLDRSRIRRAQEIDLTDDDAGDVARRRGDTR